MTLEDRVTKLETKVSEHDNKIEKHDNRLDGIDNQVVTIEKKQLTDWYELSELITRAVEKGVEKVSKELQEAKCEIDILKNAKGKLAIYILSTIVITAITVTIGWIVTGFLNNYASITSDSIRNTVVQEEVSVNEDSNIK